ncbi:MAG: hypothetical protein KKF50_00330 [Nanoarchaeota archaeon]|nr:hypothetical protein [Nanoarchaeota archaeon]
MDKKIIVVVLAVLLLAPAVVAATYTVFGTGNTNFDVEESENVNSNSIVIENASLGCRVSLNGNDQGFCNSTSSLSVGDFRDSWAFSWPSWYWRGDNQITFTGDIDNFTLTYNTGDIDGDEGEYCRRDKDCSGDCIFDECCSSVSPGSSPIGFVAPVTSSCPLSSIPIETIMNCGDRDDPDYKNIDIEFYLGATKLTPNNAILGDECTVENGVTGWDLPGKTRCGANVDVGTGTYSLRAKYTIDGDFYNVEISPAFVVEPSCSTNTPCSHAGAAQVDAAGAITTVYYNSPTAIAPGELKSNPLGGYVVAPGTEVRITGINAISVQCSNGVPYGIRQGFVAWGSAGGINANYDSMPSCDIGTTVDRDSYVGDGPGVSDVGYLPAGCNLALTASQADWLKLGDFVVPGSNNVKMDMVNAICDSPDYICPDLTESNQDRSTLCSLGSMGGSNPWQRRDGWVPLEDYDIKVVSPDISFVRSGLVQDGISFTADYDVTNTGIGAVNITDAGIANSLNFSGSCANCPVRIEEGEMRQVTINGLMNTTEVLSHVPFSELPFADECEDTGRITFDFSTDVFLKYDDGYNFVTVLPQTKTQLLNLDFEFDCDPHFPDIDVTDIGCGNFFNITDSFGFNVSVGHNDGLVRGYVDFGDGTNSTTLASETNRYLHLYSVPGNYQIIVYVEDLRGGSLKKRANVMVVDPTITANYAAACITKPEDLSNIPWSNVEFDASTSSGLICVANVGCTPVGVTGLYFSWRFSDGLINFNHVGTEPKSYKFFKNFIQAGRNWAELDVEFMP